MLSFISDYGTNNLETVLLIISFIIAILFALTFHEYAHAKVAFNQGDFTPKATGRLTINPLKHIDLMGFLCLLLVGFGWAKPVNINPLKFKEYRKGFFMVSIAGILTNLFLCFISVGIYFSLFYAQLFVTSELLFYILYFFANLFGFFASVNMCLFVFNLIPIFPLDGFNIVQSFTKEGNKFVNFMTKYGSIILLGLVVIDSLFNLNIFGTVVTFFLSPIQEFWIKALL